MKAEKQPFDVHMIYDQGWQLQSMKMPKDYALNQRHMSMQLNVKLTNSTASILSSRNSSKYSNPTP